MLIDLSYVTGWNPKLQLRYDQGKAPSEMSWMDIRADVYDAYTHRKNGKYIKFQEGTERSEKSKGVIGRFIESLYLYTKTLIMRAFERFNKSLGLEGDLASVIQKGIVDGKGELRLVNGRSVTEAETAVLSSLGDDEGAAVKRLVEAAYLQQERKELAANGPPSTGSAPETSQPQ